MCCAEIRKTSLSIHWIRMNCIIIVNRMWHLSYHLTAFIFDGHGLHIIYMVFLVLLTFETIKSINWQLINCQSYHPFSERGNENGFQFCMSFHSVHRIFIWLTIKLSYWSAFRSWFHGEGVDVEREWVGRENMTILIRTITHYTTSLSDVFIRTMFTRIQRVNDHDKICNHKVMT